MMLFMTVVVMSGKEQPHQESLDALISGHGQPSSRAHFVGHCLYFRVKMVFFRVWPQLVKGGRFRSRDWQL